MVRVTIAAILSLCLPDAALAQSFDCKKAQTRVEKVICADTALSELDEHLGRYYAAGRTELEGAASCLQTDQVQLFPSSSSHHTTFGILWAAS